MLRPARIVAGALALLFCGGPTTGDVAETEDRPVRTVNLTLADSGAVVDLRAGDHVVLELDENPTTGYRWALDPPEPDVVTLAHTRYARATGAGTGGGGRRTWTFLAKGEGTAVLRLKLWRAWEGDASIARRFTATLRVQD